MKGAYCLVVYAMAMASGAEWIYIVKAFDSCCLLIVYIW